MVIFGDFGIFGELVFHYAGYVGYGEVSILDGGVASDQIGLNSIRAEQARVCLRAITGNMAVGGGEVYVGPGPLINGKMGIRDSMLQLADKLSPEQKQKQEN